MNDLDDNKESQMEFFNNSVKRKMNIIYEGPPAKKGPDVEPINVIEEAMIENDIDAISIRHSRKIKISWLVEFMASKWNTENGRQMSASSMEHEKNKKWVSEFISDLINIGLINTNDLILDDESLKI